MQNKKLKIRIKYKYKLDKIKIKKYATFNRFVAYTCF